MNCNYCQQECDVGADVYYDGGGLAYHQYYCHKCPVRVHFYTNIRNELVDIRFLWEEAPDKRYRVFCNIPSNSCMLQFQKRMKNDWSVDEIELEFIPAWDAKTIQDKVKTYLVFS
jgi:hypothetical protein